MPATINPSERTKGKNEIITAAAKKLLFKLKYKAIATNKANNGSVNPEKVWVKYKGEHIAISTATIDRFIFKASALL